MTVEEFIEKLKKFPLDARIVGVDEEHEIMDPQPLWGMINKLGTREYFVPLHYFDKTIQQWIPREYHEGDIRVVTLQ